MNECDTIKIDGRHGLGHGVRVYNPVVVLLFSGFEIYRVGQVRSLKNAFFERNTKPHSKKASS